MNLPSPCGPTCVLPSDRSKARPLSLSARPDGTWIVEDRVVRMIASGGHEPGHPFFISTGGASISERAGLLRRIAEQKPDHVLPVYDVCDCSFVSPLLRGKPVQDFGLAAGQNDLIHPEERRISWAPLVLQRHLAELAMGLDALHGLGISHGDPALMNGYVHMPENGTSAVWVDLNSVQEAVDPAVAVDIAAFEASCLWPALLESAVHSPSLVDALIEISVDDPEPLSAYASALVFHYTDHRSESARKSLLDGLRRMDPLKRADGIGLARRRVSGQMAPAYFLDQTKSDQNARFYSAVLDMERARHLLLEEERTRLHGIRYQEEIASLSQTNAGLGEEIAGLGEEIAGLKENIAALNQQVAGLQERTLGHEAEGKRLSNELNAIYDSRAWRWVSRLRSVKKFLFTPVSKPPSEDTHPAMSEGPPSASAESGSIPSTIEEYPYLVSVVIPVYNKGSTLHASIESVRRQSLGSVEVILWDDGSTDAQTSLEVKRVSSSSEVTVFRSTNRGVASARNSAIRFSRGKYICCLDPDDQLEPTYLEKAVALLESQAEYSIAYPWVHSVGDVDEYWETQDLDASLILKANHVPICAVFRREVFNATGGFSSAMTLGYEDWEFWVHAAELGFKGKAIPEHLFIYSFRAGQAESRDASAREHHEDLVAQIALLHPRLASGSHVGRSSHAEVQPVGADLGQRNFPAGQGRPLVVFVPWLTIGGADTVVERLISTNVDAGRTVVVICTAHLDEGMPDRRRSLHKVTPFIYSLPDFLPPEHWQVFVHGLLESLPTPVILNVGSEWFYDQVHVLREAFPDLRMVDQQFNPTGHIVDNRRVSDVIDLTITAYEELGNLLRKDGRVSHVESVYVGIDTIDDVDARAISEFRDLVGLGSGQKLVLFVGRLSQEKRPEWVIRLAGELHEAKVVVIGDGPLRNLLDGATADRVVWLPHVASVTAAYAAADLVVLPSIIEGIPLVALEALAHRTPLVATRVGGLPELADIHGVVLTDPNDFPAFVGAVRDTLDSDATSEAELPGQFRSMLMVEAYNRALFAHDSVSSD